MSAILKTIVTFVARICMGFLKNVLVYTFYPMICVVRAALWALVAAMTVIAVGWVEAWGDVTLAQARGAWADKQWGTFAIKALGLVLLGALGGFPLWAVSKVWRKCADTFEVPAPQDAISL